jgi:HTH-type transcriptional regulator/antitoxin HipB
MQTDITTTGQLGPFLKQLRIQRGYSQAELGEKIGLSQERISKIENYPEKCALNQLLTVLMALDAVMHVGSRTSRSARAQAQAPASVTLPLSELDASGAGSSASKSTANTHEMANAKDTTDASVEKRHPDDRETW